MDGFIIGIILLFSLVLSYLWSRVCSLKKRLYMTISFYEEELTNINKEFEHLHKNKKGAVKN
jgi:hypothetical protein